MSTGITWRALAAELKNLRFDTELVREFGADPDSLAAEFASRNVKFLTPLQNNDDGLRGFEIQDADGYILYFGRQRND